MQITVSHAHRWKAIKSSELNCLILLTSMTQSISNEKNMITKYIFLHCLTVHIRALVEVFNFGENTQRHRHKALFKGYNRQQEGIHDKPVHFHRNQIVPINKPVSALSNDCPWKTCKCWVLWERSLPPGLRCWVWRWAPPGGSPAAAAGGSSVPPGTYAGSHTVAPCPARMRTTAQYQQKQHSDNNNGTASTTALHQQKIHVHTRMALHQH